MACKLKLAFALVPALVGTQAHALGLGGMRLQSALDQPFAAEIDLVDVKPDELDAVKVQVASQAEFARSGTERYHYLTKLRFSPQISPRGNPVVRVSSREPIREPYMDFLVEVVWPKGRMVKQYTLLLDPPVTSARSAPAIAPPAIEGRTPRGARPAPIPAGLPSGPAGAPVGFTEPKSASAPPPSATVPPPSAVGSAAPLPGGKRLEPVRPGTTLWRLARAHTPPGATVSQTATALYRNNPDAFINGDINRLRVGRTLVLPPAAEVFALSPEAAKQEFDGAMRGKSSRRTPLTEPGSLAGGESDAAARLRLVGAPDSGAAGRDSASPGVPRALEQDVLIARETSESARQETTEMRGRIRELESQLAEIQQLLKLRNEQLERVQGAGPMPGGTPAGARMASARDPGAPEVPPAGLGADGAGTPGAGRGVDNDLINPLAALAGPEGATGEPAAVGAPGAALPGGTPEQAVPPVGTARPDRPPGGTAPGGTAPGGTAPGGTAPGGIGPGGVVTPAGGLTGGADAQPGAPVVTPVVTKAPVRPTAPPPAASPPATAEPAAPDTGDSTWRALLLPLAGVAGLTAIGIGALTWLRSRRRSGRDSNIEFDSTDLTDEPLSYGIDDKGMGSAPAAPAAALGGRREGGVDSQEIPAAEPPTSAFASLKPQEPETDEADALSEADIYIAYGRYREAEELLREEIRRNPGWMDLRFKLADALFGAKNTEALRELTNEVQAAGGDRSHPEQWRHLLEMASDTPSEVARGGAVPAAPVVGAPPPAPPTREQPNLGSDLLGDSVEQSSFDVYELDISDAQKPSADLALSMGLAPLPEWGAERRAAADASGVSGISPFPARNPLQSPLQTPLRTGVEVATQSPAAVALSLETSPPASPSQAPGGQDLGFTLGRMGMASAGRRDQGLDQDRLPDLDLSLEDLRSGDLDLFSVADSTQMQAQPSAGTGAGALELSALAAESEYPRIEPVPSPTGATSGLGGILGQPDDSASTDLLSSQWQMDSGLWDETATKLDLARAYLEMGDKESARGILEEVRNEGSEDQRAEAQALLKRAV